MAPEGAPIRYAEVLDVEQHSRQEVYRCDFAQYSGTEGQRPAVLAPLGHRRSIEVKLDDAVGRTVWKRLDNEPQGVIRRADPA